MYFQSFSYQVFLKNCHLVHIWSKVNKQLSQLLSFSFVICYLLFQFSHLHFVACLPNFSLFFPALTNAIDIWSTFVCRQTRSWVRDCSLAVRTAYPFLFSAFAQDQGQVVSGTGGWTLVIEACRERDCDSVATVLQHTAYNHKNQLG